MATDNITKALSESQRLAEVNFGTQAEATTVWLTLRHHRPRAGLTGLAS